MSPRSNDLDDIHDILATTCDTLQHFKYLGPISSVDDAQLNRNHLEFSEPAMTVRFPVLIVPKLKLLTLREFRRTSDDYADYRIYDDVRSRWVISSNQTIP